MFSFSFPKWRALSLCGLLVASHAATSHAQAAAPNTFSAQEQAQKLAARGAEAFERGRMEEANQLLRESLMRANTPEAYFWLGRIHATRAKSSPEDKRTAIKYFRRALEIQPYGEDGELTRGWLLRMDGRPKSVRFMPARWQMEENRRETRQLIEHLTELAQIKGYKVIESPREALFVGKNAPEKLKQYSQDDMGNLTTGWLVCVGVESMETPYQKAEGKRKSGYRANGSAQVQIFDPISNTLHVSASVRSVGIGLFTPLDSRADATSASLSNMSDKIWSKYRVVIGANPNPIFLDETTFPSQLAGVYGRAAVPYNAATSLPLLALTACGTQDQAADQEGTDAARVLSADLQSELLRGGTLAVITPGGMRAALARTGADSNSSEVSEVCAAARATGARYALVSKLTQFDVYTKDHFILTKVIARAQLVVVLLDARTEQPLLTRKYEEKLGVKKWMSGDSTGAITDKRVEALQRVRTAAAKDILKALALPNAPGVAPSRAANARG